MSNFLENYGKSIFVLVLIAILIAFASPLGIKIKEYTLARVDNLKQTSDDLIAGKPKVDPNEPKEVTDIYAILYTDGELDLSSKEIVPEKGREVIKQWGNVTSYYRAWTSSSYNKQVKTIKILDAIKPETCYKMFKGCSNLTTLINFDKLYTSEVENFASMFENCTSLTDISSLKNLNVSNGTDFNDMFKYCESLYDATCLDNWNLKDSATKTDMFETTYGTIKNSININKNEIDAILYSDGELVLSNFKIKPKKEIEQKFYKINPNAYPWSGNAFSEKITTVSILDEIKPSTCKYMFLNCVNLKTLNNFEKFYTSNVLSFNSMFYLCTSLTDISSLKNWNVSNGTDFNNMFKSCTSLTDISSLKNWNVSNGTNFAGMFFNCTSLTDISSLKNWNVSNCTNFASMFENCTSLTDISSLKNWDVSNGKKFSCMFKDCESLYDATCLNNWKISDSAIKDDMFYNIKVTEFPSWYK